MINRSSPRPITTALTALAVVASAWPLNTLMHDAAWMVPTVICIAAVALTGVVGRAVRTPSALVPVLQILVLLGVLVWLFPGSYHPFTRLLPGAAEWHTWSSMLTDAVTTLRAKAPPVETTPSVQAILAAGIALVAVWCDALAVTWRMPALSALPLMVPFLTAVANSDHPLPWYYPALVVLAWMLTLLSEDGSASRAMTTPRPWRHPPGVALALVVAIACVAASSLAVPLIPHPESRYLTQGLGRGSGGGPRIKFAPSTDLSKDLRSQSSHPVLTYRTDDPRPGPLRIAVSSVMERGVWRRDPLTAVPSTRPVLPYPVGVDGATPQKKYTMSVEETALEAPLLATPGNVVGGTVTGARWSIDARTGIAVTDVTPVRYELSYLAVDVSAVRSLQRRQGRVPRVDEGEAAGNRGERVLYDLEVQKRITEAVTPITRRAKSDYEIAVGIQNWLRSEGGFTYSLELGVETPGPKGDLDSGMMRFLQSKKGYCVHFATAMVLMAFEAGLPARFVTGFQPGTPEGNLWRVKASDAHAWPEILLPGMGWTRFEPTPSGATPSYAPGPTPSTTSPRPSTSSSASPRPEQEPTATRSAAPSPTPTLTSWTLTVPTWVWWVVGAFGAVLLLCLAALGVVYRSAQERRRRRLLRAEAAPPDQQVALTSQATWENLEEDLADLGVPKTSDPTASGRLAHYTHAARLDDASRAALREVVDEVEEALYAPAATPGDLYPRARMVVGGAAAATTRAARLSARWFPRSGRQEVAEVLTRAAKRPSRRNLR